MKANTLVRRVFLSASVTFVITVLSGDIGAQQTTRVPAAPAPGASGSAKLDPWQLLSKVFDKRDPNHAVAISADKARVQINKDELRFRIISSKGGYVYVFVAGSDRSHLFLLFPNRVDSANRIEAGKEMSLPRPNWRIEAAGPRGTDSYVVMVSEQKRDFSAAGPVAIGLFAEFPLNASQQTYESTSRPMPLLAGKALCASRTSTSCSESYGAAAFSIVED